MQILKIYPLIIAVVIGLVVMAVLFFIWGKINRKSRNLWVNVRTTQLGHNVKSLIGYILLLVAITTPLIVLILLLAKNNDLSNVFFDLSVASDAEMTSATLFATLITVLLALIALSVTAHVFLNDALLNRKDYEEMQIKNLKRHTTQRMFFICIFSGLCITLCLFVDNANLAKKVDWSWIRLIAVIISFFDILALVLFINSIVNYEKHLMEYARSYIRFNQPFLTGKKATKSRNSNTQTNEATISDVVKSIGDLEDLVNNILKNHESEYRYQRSITSEIMLNTILKKKLKNNLQDSNKPNLQQMISQAGATNASENDFCDEICRKYSRLIEIRNCIWILQDNDESAPIDSCLNNSILKLGSCLSSFAFRDERFIDLSFIDEDFSNGDFTQSSMRKSAFLNSSFANATLKNCDFSDSLLQNVNFCDTNCNGLVLSDARIVSPSISAGTNFENAVLSGCEITLEENETIGSDKPICVDACKNNKDEMYSYNFKRVSCQRTFFSKCCFIGVNFDNSVFTNSSLEESKIIECSFEYADMKGAILVNAIISRSCVFGYSDCSDIVAVSSIWGFDDEVGVDCLELTGARFVHANMAYTKMTKCLFNKAYMNDATFTAAKIDNCIFVGSLLSNVDFTDAVIENSDFSHSLLHNALFIGGNMATSEEKRQKIIHTSFVESEMNNCSIKNYNFENCSFDKAVLDCSVIRNVTFNNCTFNYTWFSDVLLFNVNFRNCKGRILRSAANELSFGLPADRINWKKAFGNKLN